MVNINDIIDSIKKKKIKVSVGVITNVINTFFNKMMGAGGGVFNKARKAVDEDKINEIRRKSADKYNKFKDKLIVIKDELLLIFEKLKAKNTPLLTKILAVAALIYLIMPIDIIPDFLGLGLLDDIIVIVGICSQIIGSKPSDSKEDT